MLLFNKRLFGLFIIFALFMFLALGAGIAVAYGNQGSPTDRPPRVRGAGSAAAYRDRVSGRTPPATQPGEWVPTGSGWVVLGWNDLGMHCMDGDFSVFSLLPPYNTIHAQVIDNAGHLVLSGSGITVTYEAIADPTGSINRSSAGKTNFWTFIQPLFGVSLPIDTGLKGNHMPGASNTPQAMGFDSVLNQYGAVGIPITPYDDAKHKNYYPMMKLVARDSSGTALASARIVLPLSDEMDCRACHASGVGSKPPGGWAYDANAERDYKRNILRVHDGRSRGSTVFQAALGTAGYDAAGLAATADGGTPILCARCHLSNALSGVGIAGANPLTESLHSFHAGVVDPVTSQPLGDSTNRTACYRCHPGSATRCLRGVMGNSVAADGSMQIQCQNCHGLMADVGRRGRSGWLDEPSCQNCHTGTATSNSGQIRYTSALSAPGMPRLAFNDRFATNADVPATGHNLYRFSKGPGGLQCEGCHGSTHAEFPSSHQNDNLLSQDTQGHVGTLAECESCHTSGVPSTLTGGPHGMHPIGASWVSVHNDAAEGHLDSCAACHGTDHRGTVLSRALGDRTLSTEYGTLNLWRGFQVSCYSCHNGPNGGDSTLNPAPTVASDSLAVAAATGSANLTLRGTDPRGNTLTYRVVTQPANGTVAVAGNVATYRAISGFTGGDTFTFAAWNGYTNSNLAAVAVIVK